MQILPYDVSWWPGLNAILQKRQSYDANCNLKTYLTIYSDIIHDLIFNVSFQKLQNGPFSDAISDEDIDRMGKLNDMLLIKGF